MKPNVVKASRIKESEMDEIDILPNDNSRNNGQVVHTPTGVEYSMSIRDYQNLSRSNLKINKKKTNRNNRKQTTISLGS